MDNLNSLDVLSGGSSDTVLINGKTYKVSKLSPYILGQLVGYIKDMRRSEIIQSAKDIGIIDYKDVLQTIANITITESELTKEMADINVLMRLVFYAIQANSPEFTWQDMKYLDNETLGAIAGKIMGGIETSQQEGEKKNS